MRTGSNCVGKAGVEGGTTGKTYQSKLVNKNVVQLTPTVSAIQMTVGAMTSYTDHGVSTSNGVMCYENIPSYPRQSGTVV